jgi:hypothetical protein
MGFAPVSIRGSDAERAFARNVLAETQISEDEEASSAMVLCLTFDAINSEFS